MCIKDLSSCELIALASSIAVFLGENLSNEEISTLSAFFSSLGDNLAIISTVPVSNNLNNKDLPSQNKT